MNKLQSTLAFLGILLISGIAHELFHVLQSLGNSDHIEQVCVFGYKNEEGGLMNIAGGWESFTTTNRNQNLFWTELPAYVIQSLVLIFLIIKTKSYEN